MIKGQKPQETQKRKKLPSSPQADRTILANHFHGRDSHVEFQDKKWKKLDSSVDFASTDCTHFVSLGASSEREKLFIHTDSFSMLTLKLKVELVCEKAKTVSAVLKAVNQVIYEETDPENKRDVEKRLKDFLAARKCQLPENELVCVYLDELIKEKILVCRHQAVMAAILLGHLVKEKMLPEGVVRQYRATIQRGENIRGGHTWVVFRNKETGAIWLCDPTWQAEVEVEYNKETLKKQYGNIVIEEMIKRLDQHDRGEGDIYQNLLNQFNACSKELYLKKCHINAGGKSVPEQHLRIEFAEDKHAMAFISALKRQGILYKRGMNRNQKNPVVMISKENNAAITSLKMDIFQKDFNTKLVLNEKNETEKIEKKEQVVVEMMGNLNILSYSKAAEKIVNVKEPVNENKPRAYSRTKSTGHVASKRIKTKKI